MQELEGRVEKIESEFCRGFDAGRKAMLRSKNSSGCCCVFDENENLVEACKLHADWKKQAEDRVEDSSSRRHDRDTGKRFQQDCAP